MVQPDQSLSPSILALIDHGVWARAGALEVPSYLVELETSELTPGQAQALVGMLGLGHRQGERGQA